MKEPFIKVKWLVDSTFVFFVVHHYMVIRTAICGIHISKNKLFNIFHDLSFCRRRKTYPTVVMVTNAHQNPSQGPRVIERENWL